jgi:hypothetical protein
MYCPHCRTEYVEGIYVCSDCGAQLVLDLPPEPEPEYVEFVEFLYPLGSEAPPFLLIKPVLEAEGIMFYVAGEYAGIAESYPRLMVRRDQVDQLREIIEDLEASVSDQDDGEGSSGQG